MIKTQICTGCNEEKEHIEENFYKTTSGKLETKCKICVRKQHKLHYENNRERILQEQKIYTENNKEKIQAYQNEYKITHKNEIAQTKRTYFLNNEEHIQEYQKEYYETNKKELRKKQNEREKNRMKTDPAYKLYKRMSGFIRSGLKGKKNGKSIKKHLPYTFEELRLHIESLFEPWMNWKNQGVYNRKTWKDDDPSTWVWNLDHIIPQSWFEINDLKDDAFIKCWDLSNLRPLSAKQNVIDGNRR